WKTWKSPPGWLKEEETTAGYNFSRSYEISYEQLIAGLQFTKSLHDGTRASPPTVTYNVQTYNCTDAAIGAAQAVGVTLSPAFGSCSNHWTHSFSGNCPGVLGDILN